MYPQILFCTTMLLERKVFLSHQSVRCSSNYSCIPPTTLHPGCFCHESILFDSFDQKFKLLTLRDENRFPDSNDCDHRLNQSYPGLELRLKICLAQSETSCNLQHRSFHWQMRAQLEHDSLLFHLFADKAEINSRLENCYADLTEIMLG